MLRPSKHAHPDQTVINMSLLLLSRMKEKRIDDYSDLRLYAKEVIKGGEFLFLPSMNFLYLLGLINYLPKTDSFEYIGPNEII